MSRTSRRCCRGSGGVPGVGRLTTSCRGRDLSTRLRATMRGLVARRDGWPGRAALGGAGSYLSTSGWSRGREGARGVGVLQPLEDQGCLVEVGVKGGAVAPVREARGRLGGVEEDEIAVTDLAGLEAGVDGSWAAKRGARGCSRNDGRGSYGVDE